MKKIATIALFAGLAGASLSAQAQITLDGVINAAEIGSTGGKYASLGAFSTPHVGTAGFGNAGLLHMYGANSSTKLYVALAGTIEAGGNNFQLYMDLPNKTGVPVGMGLPDIAGTNTVFGTFGGGKIGGTKLELEADAAIATTGNLDVQAAIYTATTGVAKSLGDGTSTAASNDGLVSTLPASTTTGVYSLFAGTRVAYLAPTTPNNNITANPGNANGGGAGSYGLEYEFSQTSLGLPSGASIVQLFAAYVSGDAFWSSDIIPETAGNGTTTGGNNNIGFSPDFTDQTKFPGIQAAVLNMVVLSSRQADDAVVAMSVFPNPGWGAATIAYRVLGGTQPVAVRVLDLVGRDVRTLLNAPQSAGFHELRAGLSELAAGVYLVKVQVGDKVATRRLEVTR